MKSMKFLSLSLLLVSFGGSVLASETENTAVATSSVTETTLVTEVSSTSEANPTIEGEQNNNNNNNDVVGQDVQDEGFATKIISTVKNGATKTNMGLGITAAVVVGGTIAYKTSPTFNKFVNETASMVKEQVEDITKDNKKTALVAGGIATAVALGGTAYYLDLPAKISGMLPTATTEASEKDVASEVK